MQKIVIKSKLKKNNILHTLKLAQINKKNKFKVNSEYFIIYFNVRTNYVHYHQPIRFINNCGMKDVQNSIKHTSSDHFSEKQFPI